MIRVLWSGKAKDMPKRMENGYTTNMTIVEMMGFLNAKTIVTKVEDGVATTIRQ